MKTDADRLNDTKLYLSNHILPAQYNEVVNLVTAWPNKAALSTALSIGNASLLNSGGRRAKRALALLAMLFIQDANKRDTEVARLKNLPEGSEAPLIAEIKSWFTVPGVTAAQVSQSAAANIAKMPTWNNINYDPVDAVRGVYHANKTFNCYNACVFWAFQAGAISKRYLWNELHGTNGDQFFPIYSRVGWTEIYKSSPQGVATQDDYNGGPMMVPAGRTVYFETPTKVFGHVAWSLGTGSVISQNAVVDFLPAALNGPHGVEWEKMTRAVTHIIPIREMVNYKFNGLAGYKAVKVSNGAFWDPIPANQR